MNDAISTMHSAESQLVTLPVTTTSGMTILNLVTPADAAPPTSFTIILAITALIGLLVGVLVMLLLIYLDTRLFAPEQVREKIGLACLGSLSWDRELQTSPAQVHGPVIHEVTDIGASLRLTGVLPDQWRAPQGAALLITSAQSKES